MLYRKLEQTHTMYACNVDLHSFYNSGILCHRHPEV